MFEYFDESVKDLKEGRLAIELLNGSSLFHLNLSTERDHTSVDRVVSQFLRCNESLNVYLDGIMVGSTEI